VLKSVEFPSVLVETAFINNPAEAKLLNSRAFQEHLADQLTTGVKNYFDKSGIVLKGAATP
jgi:N-acetylmuramoyl-L-alanine amidase